MVASSTLSVDNLAKLISFKFDCDLVVSVAYFMTGYDGLFDIDFFLINNWSCFYCSSRDVKFVMN